MVKIFISQPMNGKTNAEIKKSRKLLEEKARNCFINCEVEIIDSFFEDAPHDAKPLWFLGKSLQLLSSADYIIFGNGWEEARGCRIERECALQYGIGILYV